jgi:hypothetical protein
MSRVSWAKLLFIEKASCGSSAIVLPGGEYVIMLSDSHLIGFSLTKEMISEALRTKNIKNYSTSQADKGFAIKPQIRRRIYL